MILRWHTAQTYHHDDSAPEVEVFRHVNLLEDIHEPLLFRGLVDLVIKAHRKYVRALTMVDVVTAE